MTDSRDTRGRRIAASLLLALGALTPVASAQSNLLVLLADDLGVDMLAPYGLGSDLPNTPNIDALADQGVLFRNVWSNPVCSTTRATILTGRYSFRHGLGYVTTATWALPASEVTLPEALDLGGAGAPHGAFGKWHLGNDGSGGFASALLAGFSHHAGPMGNIGNYRSWTQSQNGMPVALTGYVTTRTVADALEWIGTAAEPWVCYVAFNAPHAPFHTPPPELHTVNLQGVAEPAIAPRPYYKAMVEAMDTEIGKLLTGLGAMAADTNIVFLGDNGTPTEVTVAPFRPSHAKGTVYEGGIRVPLIITGPAVSGESRDETALVATTDLFATALDLFDVPPPEGVQSDSVSLLPYLQGAGAPSQRTTLFSELFKPSGPGPYTDVLRAVRDRRFKLVLNSPPDPTAEWLGSVAPTLYSEEFFDLVEDPFERRNLLEGPLTSTAFDAYERLHARLRQILGS